MTFRQLFTIVECMFAQKNGRSDCDSDVFKVATKICINQSCDCLELFLGRTFPTTFWILFSRGREKDWTDLDLACCRKECEFNWEGRPLGLESVSYLVNLRGAELLLCKQHTDHHFFAVVVWWVEE